MRKATMVRNLGKVESLLRQYGGASFSYVDMQFRCGGIMLAYKTCQQLREVGRLVFVEKNRTSNGDAYSERWAYVEA